jgi:hypothetical protein
MRQRESAVPQRPIESAYLNYFGRLEFRLDWNCRDLDFPSVQLAGLAAERLTSLQELLVTLGKARVVLWRAALTFTVGQAV